ncbi:cyclic nucleotide-binding domain-containing protein [Vitiosangium sp. GDMCC 1.1324]|uniref:cyclic nucleotide-binding domain-containing protein n=1 Tax=Vitiosangium sp. (strain GDMCC 1.1324) TaxID=2138576 RepID=UPI000D3860D8|nr:cyclic nucleotide-binding domain-containing protein [Vitiosangium sp. GDMCC 1.1324]PTL76878.1 cyclic nucleotide-binding domain-containing protein [Vitiosangium sp. GDMCC 1.1324]
MSDTPRQQVDEVVQLPSSEQPEEALSEYEHLAEAWARQGWLLRAIALCKVILRLEPDHEPTRRLFVELDARRMDPLTPPGPSVPMPVVVVPANEMSSHEGVVPPRVSLLARLGEKEFLSVMEALELRDFQPGETIVEEGEPGNSMFAIVEGSVEVVRTLKSGRRRTVAFLGEGDFFGEVSILSDVPRLASVRAFERTAVLELTRARLDQIVQRHPSVAEVLRAFHRERLLTDVLRANPIFRLLSPDRREAVARDFELCARPEGVTLLEQGKPVDALYLLLRGQCQALHRHPDGGTSLLRTLGEGDMFGEISLMLGLSATATVRSETACLLLRLDWGSCERHLLDQPGLCEALSRLGNERLLYSAGMFWAPPAPGDASSRGKEPSRV